MAFDPLQYLKEDEPTESAFDPSSYITQDNRDIPTDEEFGEIKGYMEPTRELSLTQQAINKAGEIMSGGGQKVYSEYATPEDIEYEKQSKIKALAEVPYSIGGDLLALASSGAGEVAELFGAENKDFSERMATSYFRPEISEKGQKYKEKTLENLQALGPFSGDLGALSRLKAPVSGIPKSQFTHQLAVKTAEKLSEGKKAIGKGIDLTKANVAHVYNSMTPVKQTVDKATGVVKTFTDAGKDVVKAAGSKMKIEPNKAAAEYFMNKALNPTIVQHSSGAGKNATNYMLNNRINPTKSGVEFIENDITKINKQVDNIINANRNKTIRKSHIFDNLDDARNKFVEQVDNVDDITAFDKVINNFKERFKGQTISVKRAHEIKKNTYQQINKKYGEMGTAQVEAQKQVARLLKEEIERLTSKNGINSVRDLNKKISEAVDTLDVVTRRQFLNSNKSTFHGLSLIAHDPTLGAIQHFQTSSLARSAIGNMFNKIATESPISKYTGNVLASPFRMDDVNKLRAYSLLGPDQE